MKKLIVTLGMTFYCVTGTAAALPNEWYQCTAKGTDSNGAAYSTSGSAMNEMEARDNAIYFCSQKGLSNCKVISCTGEQAHSRP